MPNGMTLTQSYEAQRNLLTWMEYRRGDALVTQRSYSYDALGRPLTRDSQYPGKGITHNDSFVHNSRSELVQFTTLARSWCMHSWMIRCMATTTITSATAAWL